MVNKMAIKILVDSAADISQKEAEKIGITIIPIIVSFGEEEYLDGVDLLPLQFYEKLVENNEIPKTSQITAYRYEKEFKRLTSSGDQVLVITLSSKLSGTYSAACLAAAKFAGQVYVVDSLNASVGERLLCEHALNLVNQGFDIEEVVKRLIEDRSKIHVIAMVNTLEYLRKGGRIPSFVAIAGEFLSIKPVIAVIDGEVKVVGKALGSKKGNNLLNKLVNEVGIDFNMPLGIVWSGLDDIVLQKYVKDSASLWNEHLSEIRSFMIGSTIGTHVGPGTIGLAFFQK